MAFLATCDTQGLPVSTAKTLKWIFILCEFWQQEYRKGSCPNDNLVSKETDSLSPTPTRDLQREEGMLPRPVLQLHTYCDLSMS